jgi:tetratricopeptide (TPR) repeat protein
MPGATIACACRVPTCRFRSAPNACTQCHTGRSAEWAAQTVAGWFPHGRQTISHYGSALQAGRTGAPDAERQLDRLILDRSQPAIARASALPLLPPYASAASEPAITAAIGDANPLVRFAAPRALSSASSPVTLQAVASLLSDPVREVRIEAARALAGTDLLTLTPEQQTAIVRATKELVTAELVDAERPEAHLNLGLLDTRRQQPAEAEAEYRTAMRLDPAFVPALVNLADLDRARGMDQQGVELLRKAIRSNRTMPMCGIPSASIWCASMTTPGRWTCFARPAIWLRAMCAMPMFMPWR